jgi:hypothetical protein
MNLIDALKTGRKIKRSGTNVWMSPHCGPYAPFTASDVLTQDWEVESEKFVKTEAQLKEALCNSMSLPHANLIGLAENFIKELRNQK